MRKITAACLFILIIAAAVSAQTDPRFVGSWETVRTVKNDFVTLYTADDAERYWHWKFLSDGSGIVMIKNRDKLTSMEIEWKIENGKFSLTGKNSKKADVSGFIFSQNNTMLRIGIDEPNIIVLRKISK